MHGETYPRIHRKLEVKFWSLYLWVLVQLSHHATCFSAATVSVGQRIGGLRLLGSFMLSTSTRLEQIVACNIHFMVTQDPLSLLHGLLFTSMFTPWFNIPTTLSLRASLHYEKNTSLIVTHFCEATVPYFQVSEGRYDKVIEKICHKPEDSKICI